MFPLLLAVRLHVLKLEVLDLTFSVWLLCRCVQGQEARDHWNGRLPQCGHLGKFGTGETRSRRSTLSGDSFGARFPSSQSSNLTTQLVDPKLARHLNTVLECLGLGEDRKGLGGEVALESKPKPFIFQIC